MLGKTIANRYKISEEASQDSLTVLYKAQDLAENKPVFITALKEKAKARPLETLLRFKREIDQASKLNNPYLLKILSQGEFEGQDYVIKEYSDSLLLCPFDPAGVMFGLDFIAVNFFAAGFKIAGVKVQPMFAG